MKYGTMKYVAAAAVDSVVTTEKAILHGIIIGADVASAVIEISDSKTDGDGDIKVKLTGSTLMTAVGGYLSIEAHFHKGITADVVNQTDITYVYSPAM